MWVLPVGRAEQDHVLAGVQEVELPECSITVFFTLRWKAKSNSSSVLRAGNRASLIRPSPPWLSRAVTSVPSTPPRTAHSSVLLAGAVGQYRVRAGGGGGFERAEQVRSSAAGPLIAATSRRAR